jgi:hypothetical protein
VNPHGKSNNNASEVPNTMLLSVRSEACLFRAMLALENTCYERTSKLRPAVMNAKSGGDAGGMMQTDGFPVNACVPAALQRTITLQAKARGLADPTPATDVHGNAIWRVQSETGGTLLGDGPGAAAVQVRAERGDRLRSELSVSQLDDAS